MKEYNFKIFTPEQKDMKKLPKHFIAGVSYAIGIAFSIIGGALVDFAKRSKEIKYGK